MYRLAWFSPLLDAGCSPSRSTLSGAFTRELLPILEHDIDVEIFVDDSDLEKHGEYWRPGPEREREFPIFHFHRAFERHRNNPFDAFIYHLEDHPRCNYVALSQARYPGITYLHDCAFSQLYLARYRHSTGAGDIDELMDGHFGTRSARLGSLHVRGWSNAVFDKIYPFNKDVLAAGTIFVVPYSSFASLLAPLTQAPCHVSGVPLRLHTTSSGTILHAQRAMLGISLRQPVIGFAGSHFLHDRIPDVLEAFGVLCARGKASPKKAEDAPILLWLFAPPEAETIVERSAISEADRNNIRFFRPVPGQNVEGLYTVLTAFVSPRSDTRRGVLPQAWSALASGTPTILPDHGPSAEIPPGAAMHVDMGSAFVSSLAYTLEEILQNSRLRSLLKERANAYIRDVCAPDCIWKDLVCILEASHSRLREECARMDSLYFRTRRSLIEKAAYGGRGFGESRA